MAFMSRNARGDLQPLQITQLLASEVAQLAPQKLTKQIKVIRRCMGDPGAKAMLTQLNSVNAQFNNEFGALIYLWTVIGDIPGHLNAPSLS
jgi:hypothetical protein